MINFDHTTNNVEVYDEGKLAIALISRQSDCGRGRNYEQGEGGVRLYYIDLHTCAHILHGKKTWMAKVTLNGFSGYV